MRRLGSEVSLMPVEIPTFRFGRRRRRLLTAFAFVLAFVLTSPVRATSSDAPSSERQGKYDPIRAVVELQTVVPPEARTARSLGTERQGSGVVIGADGLIVTIGYLIMEAQAIQVRTSDGRTWPANIVAYDHESGFGLVRTLRPPEIAPAPLGDSTAAAAAGTRAIVASQAGVSAAMVVSRRTFAGYWEYLLDDAIFTIPPHAAFGGAGLFAADGSLIGIGSLFVGDAAAPEVASPGNMFLPIDTLKPILKDLVASGRRPSPARPWLGIHTAEAQGRVVVMRLNDDGPAKAAGIRPGDIIVGVGGSRVSNMIDFYRKAWSERTAGADVPLDIVKPGEGDPEIRHVNVRSVDRLKWLRIHKGF